MDECRIPPEGGLGSAGPPEHGYPPEPRTDQQIIDAVRDVFFLDPYFTTEQFDIDCKDGVVFLRGFVLSEEDRNRAIEMVKNVPGVKRVIDELAVR